MKNASGHQGENEPQWRTKKANRNTYDISSIKRVARTFHAVIVVQNNGKELYKNVWCTCKVAFFAN